jgi:cell wall-associated NlpC family hydrolase
MLLVLPALLVPAASATQGDGESTDQQQRHHRHHEQHRRLHRERRQEHHARHHHRRHHEGRRHHRRHHERRHHHRRHHEPRHQRRHHAKRHHRKAPTHHAKPKPKPKPNATAPATPVVAPVTVLHLPVLAAATDTGRARLAVVAAAAEQLGWPYIWGGDSRGEGGFDCSGLVDYAYAAAGFPLPGRPTAAVLWRLSTPIAARNLRPGDLVFMGAPSGDPYHVALYVGNNLVIVAPHRGEPVMVVPFSAIAWDGYGRLWSPGGGANLDLSPRAVRRALHASRRHPRKMHREHSADRRATDRVAGAQSGRVTLDGDPIRVATPPAQNAAAVILGTGEAVVERRQRVVTSAARRRRPA